MLGHMQAIDASLVGSGGELETFVEERREWAVAPLDVVKEPDFHGSPTIA